MSIMYFAKVSMSSDIYKFYEQPELYPQFLNKLYSAIKPEKIIIDEHKTQYKFNSLLYDSNSKSITGRYSKIYKGNVEAYDFEKDKPFSESKNNLSSTVNFYFDIETELIAYTAARDFGYKAFIDKFKEYLELELNDEKIKIAVELLINEQELKEKIKGLKSLEEITFTIIPPNPPNKAEFDNLFGDRSEAIYESQATQYKETYETRVKKDKNGIKVAKYFEKIISAIKDGYGSVTAKGINYGDLEETITSSDNAPRKHIINARQKDSISYIKEQGEIAIRNIIAEKNRK